MTKLRLQLRTSRGQFKALVDAGNRKRWWSSSVLVDRQALLNLLNDHVTMQGYAFSEQVAGRVSLETATDG